MMRYSAFLFLLEVRLRRERAPVLWVIWIVVLIRRTRRIGGCVLVESLLIPRLQKLIVNVLIIGCKLSSLPPLKALPRLLIVLVHPLRGLPLSSCFFLLLLPLLVEIVQVLLSKCVALELSLKPRIGLLELLESFLSS